MSFKHGLRNYSGVNCNQNAGAQALSASPSFRDRINSKSHGKLRGSSMECRLRIVTEQLDEAKKTGKAVYPPNAQKLLGDFGANAAGQGDARGRARVPPDPRRSHGRRFERDALIASSSGDAWTTIRKICSPAPRRPSSRALAPGDARSAPVAISNICPSILIGLKLSPMPWRNAIDLTLTTAATSAAPRGRSQGRCKSQATPGFFWRILQGCTPERAAPVAGRTARLLGTKRQLILAEERTHASIS